VKKPGSLADGMLLDRQQKQGKEKRKYLKDI
jgi:hypothetical protein